MNVTKAVSPMPLARATLRQPARVPAHIRDNPAPTVIALVALLAALNYWKSGSFPNGKQVATYAALGGILVIAASVAPDVVTWILLVIVLYWALTNEPAISDAFARFSAMIG